MSKRILFIFIYLATTLIQIQSAMADYRITNGSATESAWVVYSTFRPADRNWPAGWWTTGWLKILPGTTENLPIPANNNTVYIRIVARGGKEIKPTDHATRKAFRFPIHPSNVAFRVVVDKNVQILKSSHNTWTLKDATLYRYRNGGSHTILSNDINSNGINIELPSDIISEVAFAPNSTYFTVKAKYPLLTGVSEGDILYGSCIFTLHIPDGMQGFVFPIKTVRDASVDFLLSVGFNIIPLGGTLVDALKLFSKVEDLRNRELKIELHTSARHRELPKTEMVCIVLLKHPVNRRPNGIDITIEQQYRDTDRGRRIDKVSKSKRWNFDDGWAAPPAQVTVFDSPAFQLLPAEIQQYLLIQFSEFGTTESGLIPKETALLANYPNPFNPETWIPYQLSRDAEVTVSIYSVNGALVRTLDLGHRAAGMYQSRSRAAYWDGRNAFGERVASGVYFYTLRAGNFTATRRLLIRK